MRTSRIFNFAIAAIFLLAVQLVPSTGVTAASTIEEYNSSLIKNGISWIGEYYPSFYVGFAPRVENPNLIHIRVSRGNQVRITSVLDEQTVLTYLYNLKKRNDVLTDMVKSKAIVLRSHMLIDSYKSIINSDQYRILGTIDSFERGQISREAFQSTSLSILKALNPGRIFDIRIDLAAAALKWREADLKSLALAASAAGAAEPVALKAFLAKNTKPTIVAANNLLFGRINATVLDANQLSMLTDLVVDAGSNAAPSSDFVQKSVAFLKSMTGNRFDFRVVENGKYRSAIECASASNCTLSYPEMTAIYPNGSVRNQSVRDENGNVVMDIAERGVLNFVERSYGDVDLIRREPYYGFMPKMDFSEAGNALHNPGVRTYLPGAKYKALYSALGIPPKDEILWIVSRGQVSHGCTRLAAGHLWETRNIFPANPRQMTSLRYSGNYPTDFDLFDVDGSGNLKVMGVDYLIAYAILGDSGAAYREGNGLIAPSFQRSAFYEYLYGKQTYTQNGEEYIFSNPSVSYFTGAVAKGKRASAFSMKMTGDFPLYQQAYEQDKIQFYDLPRFGGVKALSVGTNNFANRAQQFARLFGRITGCGPFANEFKTCNEVKFESEMGSVLSVR